MCFASPAGSWQKALRTAERSMKGINQGLLATAADSKKENGKQELLDVGRAFCHDQAGKAKQSE
jgi:hypothetical protein